MTLRTKSLILCVCASSHTFYTEAFAPSKHHHSFKVSHSGLSVQLNQQSDANEFNSMTVVQLKEELKRNGLKVSGKKDELVQRLEEYFIMEEEQDETLSSILDDSMDISLVEEGGESSKSLDAPSNLEDASFSDLNLMDSLLDSISMQGWEDPTPIQQLAIPTIIKQFSDINGCSASSPTSSIWAEAPTGSGKTGAFALPLIQLTIEENKKERNSRLSSRRIKSSPGRSHQRHLGGMRRMKGDVDTSDASNDKGVTTLVLCPTRELAFQIGGVFEELIESMSSDGKNNHNSLDVLVITGGIPMEPQIEALAERKTNNKNLDILIATPGRLADILSRAEKEEDTSEKELEKKLLSALDEMGGKDASLSLAQLEDLKINEGIARGDDGGRSAIHDMLKSVKYLVLDEADRLLSQGFKADMDAVLQLLPKPTAKKVSNKKHIADDSYDESSYYGTSEPTNFNDTPTEKMKTLLFSATFPEQIQPRVEQVLRRLSGRDAPSPIRLSCALGGSMQSDEPEFSSMRQQKRIERTTQPQAILEGPASTIDLRTIRIEERDRTQALRRLINEYGTEEWDRILVFVSTRYASEHVAKKLRRYNIKASELHGKLDQDARIRRLEEFKRGKTRVLIATDLASRGLDVVGLPAVVNYDLPRSTADFTHRIGRTGRAGKKGTAVNFVTPTNEAHYNLIEKRHLKGNLVVEREVLKGFEPNEEKWDIQSGAAIVEVEGVKHSKSGLAHDKMFGGIKGRKKSKKDKLREKAAMEAAKNLNK